VVSEKKLVQIRVLVEVESPGVVDQARRRHSKLPICPHPGKAPTNRLQGGGGFIVSSELDEGRRPPKWEELLNE